VKVIYSKRLWSLGNYSEASMDLNLIWLIILSPILIPILIYSAIRWKLDLRNVKQGKTNKNRWEK